MIFQIADGHDGGGSGMRVQEFKKLRWQDVTRYDHVDRKTYLRLYVRGKNAPRRIIGSPIAIILFNDIRRFSNFTGPDDFVFCDDSGKMPQYDAATFMRMAKTAGLFYDREGQGRPLYSLRHTFATQSLIKGDIPLDAVADNMGHTPQTLWQTYRHVSPEMQAHYWGDGEVPMTDLGQQYIDEFKRHSA